MMNRSEICENGTGSGLEAAAESASCLFINVGIERHGTAGYSGEHHALHELFSRIRK